MLDNNKLKEVLGNDFLDVYEVSEDGILIIDSEATIVYCNELWVNLCAFDKYGYTRDKMIGTDLNFYINSGIGIKAVALKALKDKKKTVSMAYSLDDKAIVTTAVPFFNEDGGVKYVVAFVKDESEIQHLKASVENVHEIQSMYIDYLYNGRGTQEKQIIMKDAKVKDIYVRALKVSNTNATILINGESGSGKDVLANFIHDHSTRNDGPFIAINCGAIPESLVESEFFGYERGAFTGASKEGKKGFFEAANKGTLFLDEIAELPVNMQIKLLRVLETQQIIRVGGTTPIDVDVRIIAATNSNLLEKVETGEFRLDLYYRINVIRFEIPPLRERSEDIEALVKMFISQFSETYVQEKDIDDDAIESLKAYNWPGNIRELRNIVESLFLMNDSGVIHQEDAREILDNERNIMNHQVVEVKNIAPLKNVVEEAERQLLVMVSKERHNSRDIAAVLEIDQTTASRKLKKYGIDYK